MSDSKLTDLKPPAEATALTELFIWAGKNGQGEAVKDMIDAVDAKDWGRALEAGRELEEFAQATEGFEKLGKGMDVLDKANKAMEIGEAIQRGDYEYAGVKLGAEVVDAYASGYLQSLGPGGIALDYATHQTGDYLAGLMDEYQGHVDQHVSGQADFNETSVAAWQHMRDYIEDQVDAQLQAGKSPDEVADWATGYMDAHGAVYEDLKQMDGIGQEKYARDVTDKSWIIEHTYDYWYELPAETQGPLHAPKNDEHADAAVAPAQEVALADTTDADAPAVVDARPEAAAHDEATTEHAVESTDGAFVIEETDAAPESAAVAYADHDGDGHDDDAHDDGDYYHGSDAHAV